MTNATAPSGPVEPRPGQAAAMPWDDSRITQATDSMDYREYDGSEYLEFHAAKRLMRRIRDDERAATAERVEALERSLSVGDALYHGAVDVVAKLDDEIASLKQALAESRRLLAEAGEWELLENGEYSVEFAPGRIRKFELYDQDEIYIEYGQEVVKLGDYRLFRRRKADTGGATSGGQQDE